MIQETSLRWLALVCLFMFGGRKAHTPACQWCSDEGPCVSLVPRPPCTSLVSPERLRVPVHPAQQIAPLAF